MSDRKWSRAYKGICPVCNSGNTSWVSLQQGGKYLYCSDCDGAPMSCFNGFTIVRAHNPIVNTCPSCRGGTSSEAPGKHVLIMYLKSMS